MFSNSDISSRLDGKPISVSTYSNLYAFYMVARYLSFKQAADELCLTSSALSHRISNLEREIEIRLFDRYPRRVQLTEDGVRIFNVLEISFAQISSAIQDSALSKVSGRLRLYVRPSLAGFWLIPRIHKFQSENPALMLDIKVGNESVDDVKYECDVILTYSDGVYQGMNGELFMIESMAPVCSKKYYEEMCLSGKIEEISRCTILFDAAAWDNATSDAEWQLWLRAKHLQMPEPGHAMKFDNAGLCALAAVNHAGISMGRERIVRSSIASGDLITPFGDFVNIENYGYYAVYPKKVQTSARLKVFLDWLHKQADD
ncbi:DNA-binding transcriptional regulator DsdC [Asaia prunellae]|uniref:DNA-binding transcriptional regulator DsdC n=1 Tax=Asaia prunellae TaxID=610245 RepID=UPI000A04BA51|nr:DNA-binding transcriptional regulator DsdC [Asaia prunellae]